MTTSYGVACYFARQHGLACLETLIASERFHPVCLLTHRRKAHFEDPERGERPDFLQFQRLANEGRFPLYAIDSRRERDATIAELEGLEIDLLASISWRLLITPRELALPHCGGVNLHRGRLPEYPGAFPLHRALENRDLSVGISAHLLEEEIDAGEVLEIVEHPVEYVEGRSLDEHVDALKREITTHFGPLLLRALEVCVARHA